ncbi:MAG: metallophosphoesterase, partial [Pseudomonadota bacterium]
MVWALLAWGLALFVLYSWWIEPAWRLRVQHWTVRHPAWAGRVQLKIVIVSDIHAGWPHVSTARLRRIVARANAQGADLAVSLGDLGAAHPFAIRYAKRDVVDAIKGLTAPLGCYYVLGNHDWWQDKSALDARSVPEAGQAIADAGLALLDNEAVALEYGGKPFWVAGLGDQRPISHDPAYPGFDDMDQTMAEVTDDAPVILLAHEPDVFPNVPQNVILTLSGHTHGGQVRFGNWSP